MLYCWDEKTGDIGLVAPTPKEFNVVSSFRVTKGKGRFWAHPAIAPGRLYLRHGEYLMVYDIRDLWRGSVALRHWGHYTESGA